jgi:hypothetical protein
MAESPLQGEAGDHLEGTSGHHHHRNEPGAPGVLRVLLAPDPLGQSFSFGMVIRQAGPVIMQSIESPGGDDSGLPHPAAQHLAETSGARQQGF